MRRRLRAPVNARTVALVLLGLSLLVGRAMAQLGSTGGGIFNGGTITTPLLIPDGLVTAPGIAFASNGADTGWYLLSSERPALARNGALAMFVDGSGNPNATKWCLDNGNGDVCLTRVTANVAGFDAGDWFQSTAGRSFLAADYTNATAAFTSTALSITVISGRKYTFQAVLFLIDSTAADGAQADFNGGTAAATNFRVHCLHYDTTAAVLKSTQVAALATVADSVATTGTGQNQVVCNGSFEPSGAGTFIVRGAQVAHTTGTLTINRGSYLSLEDMP